MPLYCIYRYERALKNKDREKDRDFILKVRKEKIVPVIDEIFKVTADALKTGQILPKSNFADAISYMHNLGDTLKTFLENLIFNLTTGFRSEPCVP
jgi:hypothetical protein